MSFLPIPYIVTGSVSLYLSYKTYNNYYNNLDFIELEQENKLKNEEEFEKLTITTNLDQQSLPPSPYLPLTPSPPPNSPPPELFLNDNDNKFVSIDTNKNISIEKIDNSKLDTIVEVEEPIPIIESIAEPIIEPIPIIESINQNSNANKKKKRKRRHKK